MTTSDLKNVLEAVNNQLIQLSFRWKIFCQLFDSGAENIELINKSGSNVFFLLQRLFLDDVMVCLSRITDPERSQGNENASVKNIILKANSLLSDATKAQIEILLNDLNSHIHNIRINRNKALAHADLTHALQVSALPPVTYENLERAMQILQNIVNKIAAEIYGWSTHYDVIIPYGTDGDKLLETLRRGHSNK